jgi:uncharacterized protein (TIGR02246 family)
VDEGRDRARVRQIPERAARAAATGDWREWADQFTDDATYIEHHLGRFTGSKEIFDWISSTMATPPNSDMNAFPVEWYVIDEDKGWVVCAIANRMRDVGDGRVHQAVNWSLLKYAGDGKWSYEEDLYNPNEFAEMITGWYRAERAGGVT